MWKVPRSGQVFQALQKRSTKDDELKRNLKEDELINVVACASVMKKITLASPPNPGVPQGTLRASAESNQELVK